MGIQLSTKPSEQAKICPPSHVKVPSKFIFPLAALVFFSGGSPFNGLGAGAAAWANEMMSSPTVAPTMGGASAGQQEGTQGGALKNAPGSNSDSVIAGKDWEAMTSGMTDEEKKSAEKLLEYVWLHGGLAGAASTCDTQTATHIRQCLILVLQNWAKVSGLGDFGDKHRDEILAAADVVWKAAYHKAESGRDGLNNVAPCDGLMQHINQAPIFSICKVRTPTGGAGGVQTPPPYMAPPKQPTEDNSGIKIQ